MSSPAPAPPPPVPPSGHKARRLVLFAAIFIVALCAIGVIVWRGLRPEGERDQALAAAKEGRFSEAEAGLKDALARNPNDAEAAEALARGYLKGKNPAEAEPYLSRWVELRPDDPQARRIRFDFYRTAKDVEKAYPDGRRLLELEPSDHLLRGLLVGQAFSLGRFEEAEAHCREFLRVQPEERDMRVMLAEIRRARGDGAEAGRILDELLRDFPAHTPAMLARAQLYEEAGEPHKAIPLLQEVLRLDKSRRRTAGTRLAVALERTGQPEEARKVMAEVRRLQHLEVFSEAIKTQPNNLDLHVQLAERLLADGYTDDGVSLLRSVLAGNPKFRPAHLALAAHYEKAGQPDRAAEHRKLAGPNP